MKVLLVEDSATVAAYIASILGSEEGLTLLPVASTAEDGVRIALEERPNVILMDIKLPDHDGLWAIEQIMRDAPCPIVVLSGYLSSKERDISFESLRAGAVDVLAKPSGINAGAREAFRQSLVSTVRLMSNAVVVRRTRRSGAQPVFTPERAAGAESIPARALEPIRYVLIGASTGGPELLHKLLSALPAPLPFPLLVTQHTLEGFDDTLAHWLSGTGHEVRLAREGDQVGPGKVLLAPAQTQLVLTFAGVTLRPLRSGEPLLVVDAMFESAARLWGEHCLSFVLTGMGKDGTAGTRQLNERGALTVVQAAESAVVASMPESARTMGGARWVLSPGAIEALLKQLIARGQTAAASGVRRGK